MAEATRAVRESGDSPPSPATGLWLVLPALLLTLYVYWPILAADFVSDDFVYLYRARNAPLDEFLLTPHGGHILIARNFVWLVFSWLFGPNPAPYFAGALITHLLNVVLLFMLIRRLTASPPLAALGAALWGASAAHAETLGWYSVYGHALACTAILLLLLSADHWHGRPPRRVLVLWYALALIACTSFGTGLGVVMALPVALYFLARAFNGRVPLPPPLTVLALALPFFWFALHWQYDAVSPWNVDDTLRMAGLSDPHASLLERMLELHASTRALLMPVDLFGQGLIAVLNLPIALTATQWLVRIGAGLVAVSAFLAARRSIPAQRQRLIAIAILTAAAYLAIAAGRGQMFGGLVGGRLPFFGRYHYLPSLLLTVLLCLQVNVVDGVRGSRRVQSALLAVVLLLLTVGLVFRPVDAGQKIGDRIAVERALDDIQQEVTRTPPGGLVEIPNRSVPGLQMMVRKEEFPGLAAVFVIFFADADLQGRRVRFVDARPAVLRAAQRGIRTRELIVPPTQVPGAWAPRRAAWVA